MRRTRVALLASMMMVASFAACGLEEGGFSIDGLVDGGFPDATTDARPPNPDGGSGDASSDGPQVNACAQGDPNACNSFPRVWTPIGYLDNGAGCAAGLDVLDQVIGPLGGGSCGCSSTCTVTGTKCQANSLTNMRWDNSGIPACGTGGLSMTNDTCGDFSQNQSMSHFGANGVSSGSAKCEFPGVANNAGVTAKPVRICSSQNAACKGTLCAQPHACIMRPGVHECPDDFDAIDPPRYVGTSVKLECASCGCAYSVSCGGVVTLYANGQCAGAGDTVGVDGGCNLIGPVKTYGSLNFAASPLSEKCEPNGNPPAPERSLADVQTVCCR